MLRFDNWDAASGAAAEFSDARLTHFWDGRRLTGAAWAQTLELRQVAWDVYLVFDRQTRWTGDAPKPQYWMHQLGAVAGAAPVLDQSVLTTRVRESLAQ